MEHCRFWTSEYADKAMENLQCRSPNALLQKQPSADTQRSCAKTLFITNGGTLQHSRSQRIKNFFTSRDHSPSMATRAYLFKRLSENGQQAVLVQD